MIQFLLILFLVLGSHAAQPPTVPPQYNFVFVVDTSHSMAPYKELTANLVRWAIHSGFDGQIQKGDSIDIWTYDDENHITRYPPQIWGTQDSEQLALAAGRFVEDLKFRGRSKFAPVAADLNSLLPHTKGCLVMILTDGDEPFTGLSVDIEINEYISQEKKEYSGPREPYLVSLGAVNGRITKATVHHGGDILRLAMLPERSEPAPVLASTANDSKPLSKPVASTPSPRPEPSQKLKSRAKPKASAEPPPPIIFDLPPGARLANFPPAAEPDDESDPLTALPEPVDLHGPATPIQQGQAVPSATVAAAKPSTNAVVQPQNVAKSTVNGTPKMVGTQKSAQASPGPSAPLATTKTALPSNNIASSQSPKTPTPATSNATNLTRRTNAPAPAVAATSKPTNIVAASTTTKGPNPPSPGASEPNHPPSSFGIPSIPPIAIYLALFAGFASVGLAIFMFLRKSKARHTGSIISRSLQQ